MPLLDIDAHGSIQPPSTTAKVLKHSKYGDPYSSTNDEGFYNGPTSATLYTFQCTFARSALAEVNTHRAFSRNSASSRAIPVKKMLESVMNNPYIPRMYSLAQKGMHTNNFVDYDKDPVRWAEITFSWWMPARDAAVEAARRGIDLGLHKQDVNRLLEPFMMHTAIISATELDNFFNQRLAVDEQGSPLAYLPIYDLAKAMRAHIGRNMPDFLNESKDLPFGNRHDWHLPLIGFEGDEELSTQEKVKVSIARCARVSYLTQEGIRDVDADLGLFSRLRTNNHWSPFEHVAHPARPGSGNFRDWRQARYYVERGLM